MCFYFVKILDMKIIVKNVKKGVLETQFGNGNLKNNSVSFPIKWKKVKGAKSYAITLIDKEASKSLGVPFIHWIAANIKTNKLGWDFSFQNKDKILQFENTISSLIKNPLLENLSNEKQNDYFVGPFPVESDHNYELRVYALNCENILENSNYKKENGLFFDDFQNLIKGKVIEQGFYTFLYRTKYTFELENLIENNKTVEELNKGLESNNIYFYKDNLKETIEIFSNAFYKENNNLYLKDFFVGKIHNNYFHNFSIPLEFKNIEKAKSYVITLLGNAEVKTYGVPLIFWLKTNIKADNTIIKIKSEQINEFNVDSTQKFHYVNTFGTHLSTKLASEFNSSNEIFRYIANSYGLIKIPNATEKDGIYTLTVYALDEEIKFEERENFDVINLGQVLSKIKSHVIAEGNVQFKLK